MMQDFTFFGTRTICFRTVPKFFCSVNGPIVDDADLSNTLQCLYVLSYAGIFRSEKIVSIGRKHITFHEGYMAIKVEKDKSDHLRQGDEVVIA